jgi:DNA-binding CsgD family transcriptional regulator
VNNPWNLPKRMAEVLDTLAKQGAGSSKVTARLMGLSHRTVEVYVLRARAQMGVGTRMAAVLEWDRANRPCTCGVAVVQAPSIPATWQHDAGAYARCSFCLRYTRNTKALSHRSFLCDCGSAEGWSGSFEPPGPTARWLSSDGVMGTQGDKRGS